MSFRSKVRYFSFLLSTTLPLALTGVASAGDLPSTLSNAHDQFVNYIYSIANASGMASTQQLILNNLILPLDIDVTTPYFNDEVFRLYADSTFTGGLQQLQQSTPAGQADRFSFKYKAAIEQASYQIDQNHPEIAHSLQELDQQIGDATTKLYNKINDLDAQWSAIATARGLKTGSNDYLLQQITWQGQIHYRDQVASLSKDITRLVTQKNSVRRNVYKPAERAVLDNVDQMADAYDMARPWFAQVEVEQKAAANPITAIMMGDAHTLNPGMFDIGPLILPQGNLNTFLTVPAGTFGFDTGSQSYELTQEQRNWSASGGFSFAGWSIGGGGGGSSSYTNEIKTLNSIKIHFDNIAEYKIIRGGWFQPTVLEDPAVQALLKGQSSLNDLQYVAVTLLLVRGTNITLNFSKSVNSSSWTQSSFNASGGVSFMGFGFSAGGGNSSSSYHIANNHDWTTVNFIDAPSTVRVIGVRVEPYLTLTQAGNLPAHLREDALASGNAAFKSAQEKYKKNQISYLEFQRAKVLAIKAAGSSSR